MRTTLARVLFVLLAVAALGGAAYGAVSGVSAVIALAIGLGGLLLAAVVALIIVPTH